MSQQSTPVETPTPELPAGVELENAIVEGLSAVEKKKQKNKKKKERQKQKKKDQKTSSIGELTAEISVVPESLVLEEPSASQAINLVTEISEETQILEISENNTLDATIVTSFSDRTSTESCLHDEATKPTQQETFDELTAGKDPKVYQMAAIEAESHDPFSYTNESETLPWCQFESEIEDSFEAIGQNEDIVKPPVFEEKVTVIAPDTSETKMNAEPLISEPVVDNEKVSFVSNEPQSSIPSEETNIKTQQSEVITPQQVVTEPQIKHSHTSEIAEDASAQSLVRGEKPLQEPEYATKNISNELFGGNSQFDLPWHPNVEVEQPETGVNTLVTENIQNLEIEVPVSETAALEKISTQVSDIFSPDGNSDTLYWESTVKNEPFPVQEVELKPSIVDEAKEIYAEITADAAEQKNNDHFGAPLDQPVIKNAETAVLQENVKSVDELFGSSNYDSFSDALKQDVKEEAKSQEKEKKFTFLDDDDLLDDDLLDDDILEDESVSQQSVQRSQPQAIRYQPQKLVQPQALKPNSILYNSFGSTVSPSQHFQHHLDLRKLDENKKKSDAYDFPVDLIPTKPVKYLNHASSNQYAQLQPSQPPSTKQSPIINETLPPPPAPLAHQKSNSSLSSSHYKPASVPSQQPKLSTYRSTATTSQSSQHHLDLKKLNQMKKKSDAYDFPADLMPTQPATSAHARVARSVSVAPFSGPSNSNQPFAAASPNLYAAGTNAPPVGNRYRVTSVGSNGSKSSLQANHQQFGQQPANLSPKINSFAPTVPLSDRPQQQAVPTTRSRYGPPQVGLGLQQGPPNPYEKPSDVFQQGQAPGAKPQLSLPLNQVASNRYSVSHPAVDTQSMTLNNNTLGPAKLPMQASTFPSASKYAPINYRRKSSITASNYDPYSLAKSNQQNQPQEQGHRLSTIQQAISLGGPSPSLDIPVGIHQSSVAQQGLQQDSSQDLPLYQQKYIKAPVVHPQSYQKQWGTQSQHQTITPINPEQLLGRQFPLFSWSHGNTLAYFVPSAVYQADHGINVVNTDCVLQEAFLKEFPGATKRNVPAVISFLDSQIERLTASRSSTDEEVELTLAQLLKHKLSKSSEIFDLGGIITYNEQPHQTAFKEKSLHHAQPLNKRQLVGLISSGQNKQAVSLALQHDNYALALVVSSVIGKDAWTNIVSKYLEYEFKASEDHFLPTLITILAGEFSGVIESFKSDKTKEKWAINHWRELSSAVVANNPVFLNQFLNEFGSFLAENGEVSAAYVLFITGELPISGQLFKPVSLKLIIYLEIYSLILQDKGVSSDLTEIYLQHANWLVDYNLLSEAQRYTDLAGSALKISKISNLNAKYTYSVLNDKLSGTTIADGSWFGRPKLDKVWGQLDKSLNKFISGDDSTKSTQKEGIFSKFSPSISCVPSFVSIPNAANNGAIDSRPAPTNQSSGLPYGIRRTQSHVSQSVQTFNPLLRSYTPSTTSLKQFSQTGYSLQEDAPYSSAFAPPSKFDQGYGSPQAAISNLNCSPRRKSSRYAVPEPISRGSPTQSYTSSVNEDLQIKSKASFNSQKYGPLSSSAMHSSPTKAPQYTAGNSYTPPSVPAQTSSIVSELSPPNRYVAPPAMVPSNLHTVSTETDIEKTTDSVEVLSCNLSRVDLKENEQSQSSRKVVPQLISQNTIQEPARAPVSSVIPLKNSAPEVATVTNEPVAQEMFGISPDGQPQIPDDAVAKEAFEEPLDVKATVNTSDFSHGKSAELYYLVESTENKVQSLVEGEIKTEAKNEGVEKQEHQKESKGVNTNSSLNKGTSDFGSTAVSPYAVPVELQVQHDIPRELKDRAIESESPESTPLQPVRAPPVSNPYALQASTAEHPRQSGPSNPYATRASIDGNHHLNRSTSASSFAPKSYSTVDVTGEIASVVPVTNQEVDFYAINDQQKLETVESDTEGTKEERIKPESSVETFVVYGPTFAKPIQSRKSSISAVPNNLYTPSVAITNTSRRSSYNPTNSYIPPAQGLRSSNKSNFDPYQPNASETNTLSSLGISGHGIPANQPSNFDDFKPPAVVSLVPNDIGSPSARMATYQPPITSHNITNITEIDEEYYDDVVDESDDDEEEEKEEKEEEEEKAGKEREEEKEEEKEEEEDQMPKQQKKEEKKQSNKKPKEEGGSGWFTWLRKENKNEPKVYKAKLGEQNNFYYDENLKRWINKNAPEEDQKAATPPPPPPIIKKKPRNLGKPLSNSVAEPSAVGSLSLPPLGTSKPPFVANPAVGGSPTVKKSLTGDLDSLINLTGPPTAGSRRKKRGGRGYVDVMSSLQDKK